MTRQHHLRLLTPSQRTLLFVLLLLVAFLLVESLYLVYASRIDGVGSSPHRLPLLYQGALLAHVGGGFLALGLAVGFTIWHLKRALLRKTPGAISTGVSLLVISLFLGVSGTFILTAANSDENAWAFVGHQIGAVALPLLYLFHRLRSKDRPPLGVGLRWGLGMALAFVLLLILHGVTDPGTPEPRPTTLRTVAEAAPPSWSLTGIDDPFVPFRAAGDIAPESPFFPAATTTTTGGFLPARILHQDDLPDPETFRRETEAKGFATSVFLGAQTCERCHPDVTAQWAQSAHRFSSFNNPFYRRPVEGTRDAIGKKPSQFCGGCHDPAIMLAGNMTEEIDPLTPESQAGLTCLACHAIDQIHNNTGNGNYNIQDELPSPYAFNDAKSGAARLLGDYLIKAKPTVHKRRMLNPDLHRTSEFCGTCHKVNLDVPVNGYQWLRGQNEYDAWHNSGVAHNNPQTFYEPETTKTCQDCHMPLEDALLGDVAATDGKVRSHRFYGVNTALPAIRGDEDMIRRTEQFRKDSLRVDLFALVREDGSKAFAPDITALTVRPGETIRVDVVVRNKNVGHAFPGGTNDSNQGWIHFVVTAGDRVVVESGAVGDDRRVDPAAHFYQAVLVDKHGERIAKRNAQDIYTTVYANVIPPSASDLARYRFRVPDDVEGPLTIRATMKWRKFNRAFTEFVFEGKDVPDLPISTLAEDRIAISVMEDAPESPAPAAEWMRYNDYGIALLRDGDTLGALGAFEHVRRLSPDRVDGPRNLARVHLRDGDLVGAEAMMREASERAPEDAKNAFFWGRLLTDSGRLDEAERAFRRTLESYPDSRDTHERLALVYWAKGEYKKCIGAMLEVLRIDPEHRQAHYRRALCYEALARREADTELAEAYTFAAKQAQIAFEKYKLDENAQQVTRAYRQEHPHDNRMAQRLVIHELSP